MSFLTENPVAVAQVMIALFLGVTAFRIAWREDWGWFWGLILAAALAGLSFVWFPWGALGAGAIVGKLYQSYG